MRSIAMLFLIAAAWIIGPALAWWAFSAARKRRIHRRRAEKREWRRVIERAERN